jgi:hypothetical protein
MRQAATTLSFAIDPRNLTAAEIEAVALSAVAEPAPPLADGLDVMSTAPGEGRPPPRDFRYQQERLAFARDCAIEEAGQFGAVFRDQESGETISYAYWAQSAAAQEQLELDLSGPNFRAAVRARLAVRFRGLHAKTCMRRYQRIAERLEKARQHARIAYSVKANKLIPFWDEKAGLARYCPDDAREEAMRVDRRYRPALLEAHRKGYKIYYCVLTSPNRGAGELKKMQRQQFKRFRSLLQRRYEDGSLLFPEIEGALVVQESPLGWARDWHAHLNVIFVVRGRLDFKKLQKHWSHMLRISPPLAEGLEGEAAERCIGNALRELIKYAVAAVSAKSEQKAYGKEEGTNGDGGRRGHPAGRSDGQRDRSAESGRCDVENDPDALAGSPALAGGCGGRDDGGVDPRKLRDDRTAPAMIDWTDEELIEWDTAQRGHRRTRSYGCLYGVPRPPKEDMGQLEFVGYRVLRGGGYRDFLAPVKFIPEDKSSGQSVMQRYISMLRGLALPGIRGAGTLGDSIERDALHRSEESQHVL